METLTTVILKPGEAIALSPAIRGFMPVKFFASPHPLPTANLSKSKTIATIARRGFFNSKSKIHVRILAPERVEVNEKFFEERIRAALDVRQKHLPGPLRSASSMPRAIS
jgi:hypothetical protein